MLTLIKGDCHNEIQNIMSVIPNHSKSKTVLSFCFVDPFSLNLHFDTINKLANKFVDFLILLALDMDGRRNIKHYIKETNIKVDRFLGRNDWRERWHEFSQVDNNFQRFLANEFEKQMLLLGYHKHKKSNTRHITTSDRNLPLYHLAFFSRNSLGYTYWDECLKYSSNQIPIEF
jgi:three-Cys-motif partner protein